MSDKSFGDQPNRNIVKNPLLSTAVTGLCLEDLTHKAVLLPVAPTQGLVPRPDQNSGPQTVTLAQPDNEPAKLQSGDANSNIATPLQSRSTNETISDTQQTSKHDKSSITLSATKSKASVKSEDDFDVNEYFARLQGTRYVSAPLNSHLREDSNANLEATEENLEEINLNDNQIAEPETQQSLTADIAQNFSQLPTVLPHVASAVFSSFSNMLNLKSREQTPERPAAGYRDVQLQAEGITVPLMGVDDHGPPKEVGPPPKEHSIAGPGSYRIPSRKKYAQIPGLSSGDATQNIPYNTTTNNSRTSYFIPSISGVQTVEDINSNTIEVGPENERMNEEYQRAIAYNIFNPADNLAPSENDSNIAVPQRNNESNFFAPISHPEQAPMQTQNAPIIPPPPMFSNLPRRDSQPAIGKAILPPSVARRISANHPIIKPQAMPPTNITGTIFVPTDTNTADAPQMFATSSNIMESPKPLNFPSSHLNPTAIASQPPIFAPTSQFAQSSSVDLINTSSDTASSLIGSASSIFVPTMPQASESIAFFNPTAIPNMSALTSVPQASSTQTQNTEAVTTLPANISTEGVPPAFFNPISSASSVFLPEKSNMTSTCSPVYQSQPPQQPPLTFFNPSQQLLPMELPTPVEQTSIFAPIGPQSQPTDQPLPPKLYNPALQPVEPTSNIGVIPSMFTPASVQNQPVPPTIFNPNQPMQLSESSSTGHTSSKFPPATIQSPPTDQPKPPSIFDPTQSQPKESTTNVGPASSIFAPISAQSQPIEQSMPPTLYNPTQPIPHKEPIPNIGPATSIFSPTSTQSQSIEQPMPPTLYNPTQPIPNVGAASSIFAPNSAQTQPFEQNIPSFFNPALQTKPDIVPSTELLTTEMTPTFFNPGLQSTTEPKSEIQANASTSQLPPYSELTKPPIEPPKVAGNLNYRMTKKRPQYYSGPIEGVGAISNNIKPIIPAEPTYQPAMFTPTQDSTSLATETNPAAFFTPNQSTYQSNIATPFDISRPDATSYTPFDISSPQETVPQKQEFNTIFDLSRPTTENYEKPKEETKGFGIIGSLKSKLNALDINKIQNSVTTFFDPGYNDIKKDTSAVQENVSYGQQVYGQAPVQSNFEIFVPNVDTNPYGHAYSQPQQNMPYIQNYQSQDSYYYQNQAQSSYPGSSFVSAGSSTAEITAPSNIAYPSYTQDSVSSQSVVASELKHDDALTSHVTTAQFFNDPIPNAQPVNDIPYDKTSVEEAKDDNTKTDAKTEAKPVESVAQSEILQPSQSLPQIQPANTFFDSPYQSTSITESFSVFANQEKKEAIQPIFFNPIDLQKKTDFFEDTSITQDATQFCSQSDSKPTPQSITTEDDKNVSDLKQGDLNETQLNKDVKSEQPDPDIINALFAMKPPFVKEDDLFSNANITGDKLFPGIQPSTMFLNTQNETQTVDLFAKNPLNDASEEVRLKETNLLESLSKTDIPIVSVSTVPLFGLSTIIAEKSKEIHEDSKIETAFDVTKPKIDLFDTNTAVSFFENFEAPVEVGEIASDLNICETCREVNKPEEKDTDDLTTQLIENITSPIQLSNPVVMPLTESDIPLETRDDLSIDQLATQLEISHITEETIETLQVQSVTELLDDEIVNSAKNYGWCVDEPSYPNVYGEHDYGFKLDTNAVGFYGSNSLFFDNMPNNASDEIKAELLPRQMSIPSAPPAEEDSKSDETGGLDVHSIELDAKKDFPLDEEFVIEPSETDDDKIEFREREKSSEDTDVDTFTNRVERFKKEVAVEGADDVFDVKNTPLYYPPTISMASYFDTGNYAVETHYRNSLSSPTSINTFQLGSPDIPLRIPPGFEDEFNRRLSETSSHSCDKDKNISYIPDTSTQTPVTCTLTVAHRTKIPIGFKVEAKVPEEAEEIESLPPFATVFGEKKDNIVAISTDFAAKQNVISEAVVSSTVEDTNESTPEIESEADVSDKEITPTFTAFATQAIEAEPKTEVSCFADTSKTKPTPQSTLPDPINFFSTVEDSKPTETDNSFNRLASYFSTPAAKPEHSKSFFELSQSQNHYRHENNDSDEKKQRKSFFELSQSQNHYMDANIPHETYIANLNLMKDLTSPQHITFDSNSIVRTVNYFSVELDNDVSRIVPRTDKYVTNSDSLSANEDSVDEIEVLNKCQTCNFQVKYDFQSSRSKNFKVKSAMNDNNDSNKDLDRNMEGKEGGRKSVTINFDEYPLSDEASDGVTAVNEHRSSPEYSAVKHHWFYRVDVEEKSIWRGFSVVDSSALEEAYLSPDLDDSTLVQTDGGRYDVNVVGRLRVSVYWKEKPTNVRRCSWFYKGTTDARYVPYTEAVAERLEEEYRQGMVTGVWHRRLTLPNSELVMMHGPGVMVHFLQAPTTDAFSTSPSTSRPRVVRRGHDESEIEDPEPSSIDHLLLLCHGVGSACDMRFRSVEEVVEDFRETSLQLIQSHYRNSYDIGAVSRVEVLPISWHATLHSGESGVDRRLAQITLDSIPKLRNFTNDTVLDVLFYTSPVYCQTILNTVCKELNRIYGLFKRRNPKFTGGVSLGGHSLGSVILYDLLCNQPRETQQASPGDKVYVTTSAGTGQPTVTYPRLEFSPAALYALGSPIAIFECIRGVESLGVEFSLPTCKSFFNIFHPYDPIAYRIEPLINSQLRDVKPFLIPHHKGRKRMHLELKDTMARVGADIKQKLIESLKTTWNKWKAQPPSAGQLEKVVEEEIEKENLCDENKEDPSESNTTATPDMLGKLNSGRRVDYVLQEAPLEMINEYLFAMSSHVGYWESEDTMLLMLREIYDALGVQPDSTVPQQSMTVQRTRTITQDETIVMNASEHPSTSRGDT